MKGRGSQEETALRAVVDVIVPDTDGHPSASALGVHLRLASCLEMAQPGATSLLVLLLDMYARVQRPDATFAELTPMQQDSVLRELSADESDELRDLVDVVHVYTLNGYFSDWPGCRPETGDFTAPPIWQAMGYHGPSLEHLAFHA